MQPGMPCWVAEHEETITCLRTTSIISPARAIIFDVAVH